MVGLVVIYWYNKGNSNDQKIYTSPRKCFYSVFCRFWWERWWWRCQKRTITIINRRIDRVWQQFFSHTLMFSDGSVPWCFLVVWPKKLIPVIEKFTNILCTRLYMCKIYTYNIMSPMRYLMPKQTHFWKDLNIWFCRVNFPVLGKIISGTCLIYCCARTF